MRYFFYDTCSLLSEVKTLFKDSDTKIFISSVTISELEDIKSSGRKDEETKYAAREVMRALDQYEDKYEIVLFNESWLKEFEDFGLPNNNDTKIVVSAKKLFERYDICDDAIFVTKDLVCKKIAEMLSLNISYKKEDIEDKYTGYKEIKLNNDELANFYENVFGVGVNTYNLLENEYILIKNEEDNIIDCYKWANQQYQEVVYKTFDSKFFGDVKPMGGDQYQKLAFNSLSSNTMTVLRGPAGSGKSYIALSYLFSQLEKGKISKIIIFCNTVATRGAAQLGFYPGTRTEKLLDSQIGNFLESKFGGRMIVEKMIAEETLLLLPLADIRGFDTSGMNAGIYITEAQNTSIDLMKLALQRIGSDSIIVLDGDDSAQVDLSLYGGVNNGLRRVSEVFRGQNFYGEVTLVNIKRSKIAEVAELM